VPVLKDIGADDIACKALCNSLIYAFAYAASAVNAKLTFNCFAIFYSDSFLSIIKKMGRNIFSCPIFLL
jgi:hypothetical protein